MQKSLLITESNLRKAKGQTAAIIALILLASLMLNLWLMLAMDYKQNFDRCHERLNAEHVTLVLDDGDSGLRRFVSKTLDKDDRITEYCMDDACMMNGSFEYNGGDMNTEFVFLEKEAALNRSVGRVEILEEGEFTNGIYLPLLYSTDSEIAVGKNITITTGNNKVSYRICGFFNSVMAGSHNCSMTELLLSDDQYEKLKEKDLSVESTLVSVRIHDKEKSEEMEAALKNTISSRYPDVNTLSNSYTLVTSSRYISQMICAGVVSAMAFFVLLIALVVISSNVINYIQENMRNLGALKAIGYRSREVILSFLLQFLGVAVMASVAGIGLSYLLFPTVNDMMISQTGIPYTVRFLPLPAVITMAIICGTIALAVWLSARRIKDIDPITALRQGVSTHNFKRNHVPLDKAHAPLQPALALKTTLSGIKQNVTVCITMLVLSLVAVFSGLMVENVIVDMEPFVNLIVGETADSCININTEIEDEFLQKMEEDDRVQKTYLYHTTEVCQVDGIALLATITDDFSDVNNQSVCFKGRFPRYDNEVAIAAKYAKEKGLNIGDEITLTAEGNEAKYLISGLTQTSNYLGKDCLLIRSGYERMGVLRDLSYYMNMEDGVDIDAFHAQVSEEFGQDIYASVNVQSVMDATASVYVSLMKILVVAILLLSMVIITFVLYLLVRTMLNSKKRDYGIMKALGFTTGQLILQTALSFMPAVLLSTVAGLIISALVINPLVSVFLKGIGIVKCTFVVPIGFIVVSGIGIILFAFAMACLLSLRIKRIVPRVLLAGE